MHLQEQSNFCSVNIFEVQTAIALEMTVNWGKRQQGNPLIIVNDFEFTKKTEI